VPQEGTSVEVKGMAGSGAMADGVLDDVAALHSKFFQDPNFKGRKGKFAGVDGFDAGIESQVRPWAIPPLTVYLELSPRAALASAKAPPKSMFYRFRERVALRMCRRCSLQPVLQCCWRI
jgi:hypothetical protein